MHDYDHVQRSFCTLNERIFLSFCANSIQSIYCGIKSVWNIDTETYHEFVSYDHQYVLYFHFIMLFDLCYTRGKENKFNYLLYPEEEEMLTHKYC